MSPRGGVDAEDGIKRKKPQITSLVTYTTYSHFKPGLPRRSSESWKFLFLVLAALATLGILIFVAFIKIRASAELASAEYALFHTREQTVNTTDVNLGAVRLPADVLARISHKRVALVAPDTYENVSASPFAAVKELLEVTLQCEVQVKLLNPSATKERAVLVVDLVLLFGQGSLLWYMSLLSSVSGKIAHDLLARTIYIVHESSDIDMLTSAHPSLLLNFKHVVLTSDYLYRRFEEAFVVTAHTAVLIIPPMPHLGLIKHGVPVPWMKTGCTLPDRVIVHRQEKRKELNINENDFAVLILFIPAALLPAEKMQLFRNSLQVPLSAINAYMSSAGYLDVAGLLHILLPGNVPDVTHLLGPLPNIPSSNLHVLESPKDQMQMASIFLLADIIIVHSELLNPHTTLPMAMAMQVPLLLGETPELSEFVVHNQTGLLHSFDGQKPVSIHKELVRNLGILDVRSADGNAAYLRIGEAACLAVQRHYSNSTWVQLWLEFLAEMVPEHVQ